MTERYKAAFDAVADEPTRHSIESAFNELDHVGNQLGLLNSNESYTQRVPSRPERAGILELELAERWVLGLEVLATEVAVRDVRALHQYLEAWRERVLLTDLGLWFTFIILCIPISHAYGSWNGFSFEALWYYEMRDSSWGRSPLLAAFLLVCVGLHFWARRIAATIICRQILTKHQFSAIGYSLVSAFLLSTTWRRALWQKEPVNWNIDCKQVLTRIVQSAQAVDAELKARRREMQAKSD